jgi:hypothetical protein
MTITITIAAIPQARRVTVPKDMIVPSQRKVLAALVVTGEQPNEVAQGQRQGD